MVTPKENNATEILPGPSASRTGACQGALPSMLSMHLNGASTVRAAVVPLPLLTSKSFFTLLPPCSVTSKACA